MEFGQLMEYNKNIFLDKSYTKYAEKTSRRRFFI